MQLECLTFIQCHQGDERITKDTGIQLLSRTMLGTTKGIMAVLYAATYICCVDEIVPEQLHNNIGNCYLLQYDNS